MRGMIRAHRGALWAGLLAVSATVAFPGVGAAQYLPARGDAWDDSGRRALRSRWG